MLGFPAIPKQMPTNISDWFVMLTMLFGSILGFWWILSTLLSFFFYKRKPMILSRRNIVRILFFTMLVPCMIIFVPFIFSIFFVPLYSFLYPSLSSHLISAIGFILFLPFVFLFIAIVLPNSKARKTINHSYRRLKRKMRRMH